jgi:glucuronoarabinoxylan endo-1,4-beta-xylanase
VTLHKIVALFVLAWGAAGAQTSATAIVDFSDPRQTIRGFGGALAFYTGWVSAHPNKHEIYSALFDPVAGLGVNILRLQNVYRYQTAINFDPDASEFTAAARSLRGSPVTVLISSWSPPALLKSNGAEGCPGTKNCTLATKNGAFDYDGFASYWADSILNYRNIGVNPDYISIQNEPDWIADYTSCKFNPSESVSDGVLYAGYDRALDAVYQRLKGIDSPPKLLGPEVLGIGYGEVEKYMKPLAAEQLGGLAHHLYHGGSNAAPDTFNPIFSALRTEYPDQLRWQTEYDLGSAFQTAWIIQNSLTVEEVNAYLFWSLAWPGQQDLIYIDFPWDRSRWTTERGWKLNDSYFALKHFSYFIAPGFQRYPIRVDHPALRSSAFLSLDGNRLVAVILNTSTSETIMPALVADGFAASASSVYRSDFTGSAERFINVGALDDAGSFTLGPMSIATVVIGRQ